MEYLIKEAFLHVEDYGPHVDKGMYDLIGPHGEIVMKSVWETVVEPGWSISMHMWPLPPPPEPEEAPADEGADIVIVEEGVPPPPPEHSGGSDGAGLSLIAMQVMIHANFKQRRSPRRKRSRKVLARSSCGVPERRRAERARRGSEVMVLWALRCLSLPPACYKSTRRDYVPQAALSIFELLRPRLTHCKSLANSALENPTIAG